MLLHIDNTKFKVKPTGQEIGGIKARFTKSASIKDMTVQQIAACLTAGKTIQPGVTPFSEESRQKGKKGTVDTDFERQTFFMDDIDNKRKDVPLESPAHVAEVLAAHNLKAAFMYETFHSTAEQRRFRYALVSDEEITDRAERDRIQGALIAAFPQSDTDCINADRIFFGTDKGLIDEYTDFTAVCRKADLLAFAEKFSLPEQRKNTNAGGPKFGEPIQSGIRHNTLVSFASTVLTKYGLCEKALDLFMQRVAQCEEPMPDNEVEKIWQDSCRHYEHEIAVNPAYIPPEEYIALEFADSIEPTDYTDVGQAKVFVEQYGAKVRYSNATKWLVYNGMKWEESELAARRMAQQLTEQQLKDARQRLKKARDQHDKAVERGDDAAQAAAKSELDAAESYRAFVLGRRKSNRIAATLTEAEPNVEINVMELDKDPFKLNTPAGTVDLRTGEIHSHDPNDYCTKMTAVSPSHENEGLWLDFLDKLTCGNTALRDYLQEVAGMEIVGKVFVENLCIATGIGGNGKSSFYNVQLAVLGDYAGTLSADTLTVNSRRNKSPEFAELRGKRLVIAAELEEGMRLDTGIVKRLCSVDPIRAEKKFKDPFDFIPSHTTILYTNHLPKVGTNDKGTWDRLVVVPFLANFRGMKGEIKNYADYLFQNCGGAVLSWMIAGAKKFIAHNYLIEQPECVKEAIAEYRQQNDWFHNFLTDRTENGGSYTVGAQTLYLNYRAYCEEVGDYKRSSAEFKSEMLKAGYKWHKTKAGAQYIGIRPVSEFEPFGSSGPPLAGCG